MWAAQVKGARWAVGKATVAVVQEKRAVHDGVAASELRKQRKLLPGVVQVHKCAASEPKSPSRWAPVETMLRRPLCAWRLAKGHDGWLRRGCWSGAVGTQAGWLGHTK